MKKVLLIVVFLLVMIFAFINIREYIVKKYYPLEHEEKIKKYSNEFDVDPYLVCSVIWVESKYIESAKSEKGALGLMQIMPETGGWISDKIDLEHYSQEMLLEPETNIRLGCWYLSYLDNRFGGKTTNIVAAYNGGPNRIAEWLDDSRYSENRELVNIPIEETRVYVERVLKAYEIYKTYYEFE